MDEGELSIARYSEETDQWVPVPTEADIASGVLTARIEEFSIWDTILFWRPTNPASESKILDQARAWRRGEDVEPLLEGRPHGADGPTFREAIGALLLAEAMWEGLKDGNYYAAASVAELAAATLPVPVLKHVIAKWAGIPAVSMTATAAAVIIEGGLKAFMDGIRTSVANGQLRAYLSFRGWFFEDGRWREIPALSYGSSHSEVMQDPFVRALTPDGWFLARQLPDEGTRRITLRRVPGENPRTLFSLGDELFSVLVRVVNEDGLRADRAELARAFRAWAEEVTVGLVVYEGRREGPVIAGARVHGRDGAGNAFDKTTNVDGYVELRGEPGTWELSVSKTGYAPMEGRLAVTADTDERVVLHPREGPTAAFTATPLEGQAPLVVEFVATESQAPEDGEIVSYAWDFEDGSTSTGATATHTYEQPGTYTVTLAISDGWGGTATAQTVVRVYEPDEDQFTCTITVLPSESIQAAIDAASPGDVICLAEGEWEENLVIEKSLTIRAAEIEPEPLAVIRSAREGWPVIMIRSEEPIKVTVQGLVITGAFGGCYTEEPEPICASGITVHGKATAVIDNNAISENVGIGITLWDSAQATIENSTISGNIYGILMGEASQATIHGNIIGESRFGGILMGGRLMGESSQATIGNNTIRGNEGYGIQLGFSSQAMIIGNDLRDNEGYGVVLVERPCLDVGWMFTGYVTGSGNTGGGNAEGDTCPDDLAFLFTEQGGELDRREAE